MYPCRQQEEKRLNADLTAAVQKLKSRWLKSSRFSYVCRTASLRRRQTCSSSARQALLNARSRSNSLPLAILANNRRSLFGAK